MISLAINGIDLIQNEFEFREYDVFIYTYTV